MKRFCSIALCVILSAVLTACSEESKNTSGSTTIESESYDIGSDVAVISIETNNKSENVLDFITKPVARHVAESIASWTPGYKIPPEPYYELCTITLKDKENNVLLDGVDADVKVRGNWTTSYDKKPLRIKFLEKQNMLGLNDDAQMKNWLLLAEYKDGSMLRNKVSMSIAEEILSEDGLYTGDCEFVEVEVNGEYWGLYLLTEMQQINPNRVDITEPEKGYTETDIGYFMEFDGYFTEEEPLNSLHIGYADNAPLTPFQGDEVSDITIKCLNDQSSGNKNDIGISVKSEINSQQQHDFIESYMDNVYKILYFGAYEDKAYVFNDDYTHISETDKLNSREAIEKAINVQSLADMYIVSELTCDADIYWSSFFMDVDFGPEGDKKLTFEAPWDFDSGLGNKNRCADGQGFYAANIIPDVNDQYMTINPWLAVLMHEEWFQDIIREKWINAYDSGVFTRAYEMIDTDTKQYSEAFSRNYQRWNNVADKSAFEGELSIDAANCRTHAEASAYLRSWLERRVEFLNGYWNK